MQIVNWLGGAVLIAGIGIALYERRKKRTLLKHDFRLVGPQTESEREVERAAQAFREAHHRNLGSGIF